MTRNSKLTAALLCCVSLAAACRQKVDTAQNATLNTLLANNSYALIQPGSFLMGSSETESTKNPLELRMRPQHRVQISQAFELGKHEVTQAEWEAVMGSNPSQYKGPDLPVENVSWEDVQAFIARLQPLDDQHAYRLPTEAEWEYACRAGSTGDFSGNTAESEHERGREKERVPEKRREKDQGKEQEREKEREKERRERRRRHLPPVIFGPDPEEQAREAYKQTEAYYGSLLKLGWFYTNAQRRTHPVGQLQPNAWGLFDMQGNVWEWCQDWFDADYYQKSPAADPPGPAKGDNRVNRGGSWQTPAGLCAAPVRGFDPPNLRTGVLGFRLARTTKTAPR